MCRVKDAQEVQGIYQEYLEAWQSLCLQKFVGGESSELLRFHAHYIQEMGWDRSALEAYSCYLSEKVESFDESTSFAEILEEVEQQLQRIGSPLYERLFLAFGVDERKQLNEEQAKKRLCLMLQHLGGEIDDNGMLQLLGRCRIDTHLPPHASFWHTVAKTVQAAYPFKELTDQRIHQLRMYIDHQNIMYIRSLFKKIGMTDEQALTAYVKAAAPLGLNGRRIEREPARYHNKLIAGESYKDRVQGYENKKRTVRFHGEFILDRKGNFVSQWNVLERDQVNGGYHSELSYYQERYWEKGAYFEEQLMNGESFNYADRNDEVHRQLDVRPPGKLDPMLRKEIGRYGLLDREIQAERNTAFGRRSKWFSPERKNKKESEITYDYFSDQGDRYSGRFSERLLTILYRVRLLFRRK